MTSPQSDSHCIMLCWRDADGCFHAERDRGHVQQSGLPQAFVDAMAGVQQQQRDPSDEGYGFKDCTWLWRGVLIVHALENHLDDMPNPYYQAAKKLREYEKHHRLPSQGSVHILECCETCHLTSQHWDALGYTTKALERALVEKADRAQALHASRRIASPEKGSGPGLSQMPSGYTDTAHYYRTGEIRTLPFPKTAPWNG